jgi:hypothetical protein
MNNTIAEDGTLGDDLIIGCEDAEGVAEGKALLLKGDREAAEALLGQERFGGCALSIESPCELDDEQVTEVAEAIGEEAAGVMRQAQTLYWLTFKGMSTVRSGHLADHAWRMLGQLCGGLMDDPQTGEGFIARVGENPA